MFESFRLPKPRVCSLLFTICSLSFVFVRFVRFVRFFAPPPSWVWQPHGLPRRRSAAALSSLLRAAQSPRVTAARRETPKRANKANKASKREEKRTNGEQRRTNTVFESFKLPKPRVCSLLFAICSKNLVFVRFCSPFVQKPSCLFALFALFAFWAPPGWGGPGAQAALKAVKVLKAPVPFSRHSAVDVQLSAVLVRVSVPHVNASYCSLSLPPLLFFLNFVLERGRCANERTQQDTTVRCASLKGCSTPCDAIRVPRVCSYGEWSNPPKFCAKETDPPKTIAERRGPPTANKVNKANKHEEK